MIKFGFSNKKVKVEDYLKNVNLDDLQSIESCTNGDLAVLSQATYLDGPGAVGILNAPFNLMSFTNLARCIIGQSWDGVFGEDFIIPEFLDSYKDHWEYIDRSCCCTISQKWGGQISATALQFSQNATIQDIWRELVAYVVNNKYHIIEWAEDFDVQVQKSRILIGFNIPNSTEWGIAYFSYDCDEEEDEEEFKCLAFCSAKDFATYCHKRIHLHLEYNKPNLLECLWSDGDISERFIDKIFSQNDLLLLQEDKL